MLNPAGGQKRTPKIGLTVKVELVSGPPLSAGWGDGSRRRQLYPRLARVGGLFPIQEPGGRYGLFRDGPTIVHA